MNSELTEFYTENLPKYSELVKKGFDEKSFNEIEKKNIELIRELENIKEPILLSDFERIKLSPASLDEQGIVAAPKDVVWDIDDLSKQPPWKDNISGDITDLSDYFVTSGGEDFITLFFRALKKVEQFKNQYEAWRFSDSGEILSHRVFRDDREYEE